MAIKEQEKKELEREIVSSVSGDISEKDIIVYGDELKLSDAEQKTIIQDIKSHIDKVKIQRQQLGIENEWNLSLDMRNGVTEPKDFPAEDSHNLHIHMTLMTGDILREKVVKRTFQRPMMIAFEKPGYETDMAVIKRKQNYCNDKILNEVNLEDALNPVYDDAIFLGTGICKITHVREISAVRTLKIYEASLEGKTKFIEDFEGDSHSQLYKDNLKKLDDKIMALDVEPLALWVDEEQINRYQPEVKWVDPFNLYIDCYEPNLKFHRVIPEKMADIGWFRLKSYFEQGYFKETKILDELIKRYKDNDEYLKRTYTIWETNYKYKNAKGDDITAIITYVDECEDFVARAISFPYITNRPNYEIFKIRDKRGSIYGTGLAVILEPTQKAINEMWNLMLDSAEYTVAPMMIANVANQDFDPTTKTIGPGKIFWLGLQDKLQPLNNNHNIQDGYHILEFLHRYQEWTSGISAYMTGRESPIDPSAPASKAYMLLQESNLRINAYIKKIDQSNVRVWEQLDELYYQYFINEKKYYRSGDKAEYTTDIISRKDLGTPVVWIPQLSDISINKALEKEENMKMGMYLQAQPMVSKMPNAQRKILEIQLRSAGGVWEKEIATLLPDATETDMMSKVIELVQKVGPQGVMEMMAGLIQGGAQGGIQPNPTSSQMAGASPEAQMPDPMKSMQGITNKMTGEG